MVTALLEIIKGYSGAVYFLRPLNCTSFRGALKFPQYFLGSRKSYAKLLLDRLTLFDFANGKGSFGFRDVLKGVERKLFVCR